MIFKYVQENLEDWGKTDTNVHYRMGKENERGSNAYVLSTYYVLGKIFGNFTSVTSCNPQIGR